MLHLISKMCNQTCLTLGEIEPHEIQSAFSKMGVTVDEKEAVELIKRFKFNFNFYFIYCFTRCSLFIIVFCYKII